MIYSLVMAPPRPSHLLTDIPLELRIALSSTAAEDNLSLQNVINRALCEHFEFEFRPSGRGYREELDAGALRMVVRVEQKLFDAIRKTAEKQDRTMKQVIIDALGERFFRVPV